MGERVEPTTSIALADLECEDEHNQSERNSDECHPIPHEKIPDRLEHVDVDLIRESDSRFVRASRINEELESRSRA